MSETGEARTRILAGIALAASLAALLGVGGAIIGGRLGGEMGWDQLANGLGGFAIGNLAGLITGAGLARTLPVRTLWLVTGISVAATVVLGLVLTISVRAG